MEYLFFTILFLTAILISALLTPFLCRVAFENGVVDMPSRRKIHGQKIPRVGGMGIAFSFFTTIAVAYGLFHGDLASSLTPLTGLCIGSAIILLVGILDDIDVKGLNASKKLMVQTLAAFALLPFGFSIDTLDIPFIGVTRLGPLLGMAVTIGWVIFITNAFNLIDGMDGLSSGISAIACLVLIGFSFHSGNLLMTIVLIVLLGSTLGFLYHNWPPAKMFMGDCGAMFLGFVLSAVSVQTAFNGGGAEASGALNTTFLPVLVLGIPIMDTTAAILRRLWYHKPLFSADRKHIHHKLLNAGFTSRQANSILYGLSLALGSTALLTTRVASSTALILTAIAMSLAFLSINRLSNRTQAPEDRKAEIFFPGRLDSPFSFPEGEHAGYGTEAPEDEESAPEMFDQGTLF